MYSNDNGYSTKLYTYGNLCCIVRFANLLCTLRVTMGVPEAEMFSDLLFTIQYQRDTPSGL